MTDGRLTKDRINLLITNLFGGGIDSVSSHILNTNVCSMFTFACMYTYNYMHKHNCIYRYNYFIVYMHVYIQFMYNQLPAYVLLFTFRYPSKWVYLLLEGQCPFMNIFDKQQKIKTFYAIHCCWPILQRYEIRSRAMSILLEKGLISPVWSQKLRLFNKQHKKTLP